MQSAALLVTVLLMAGAARAEDSYGSRLDRVDVDEVLRSDRLVNNYCKCLMEQGPCTPDAADLKRILPDALETECAKCTEAQKNNSQKVIRFLIDNKPEQWKAMEAKYDPTGEYRVKYEASKLEPEHKETGSTE